MSITRWGLVGYLVSSGIVIGMGFTLWNYLAWRRAEYGKFGQGPAQVAPAQKLAPPVQSDWAGVRWSLPVGWSLNLSPAGLFAEGRVKVASGGSGQAQLTIWEEEYLGNLVGAAETEVRRRAENPLAREREYLNTEFTHAVILTWEEKDNTIQVALFAEKGKLVVVEAVAATSIWSSFEPTFDALYRSVILF